MKHAHARQGAKTSSKERIDAAYPEHLILKELPLDVKLINDASILGLRRQVDVFLYLEELSGHNLLDIALNYVDFCIKLAHFTLNDIHCISTEVFVLGHMLLVKTINLDLATCLRWTLVFL